MTRTRFERIAVGLVASLATAWVYAAVVQGQSGNDRQGFIIRCTGQCASVAASVRALGGQVTQTYQNIEAIAVVVPAGRGVDLLNISGAENVWKDFQISQPVPIANAAVGVAADSALVIDPNDLARFIGAQPADYSFNNTSINAANVHAAGNLGSGIITAVIDSGTANSPVVPALAGTVIGGESFVALDPVASATSRRNGPHGTWVGTVIAGHANFLFANTSTLVRSLRIHAPSSVIACTAALGCPVTASIVPMVGVAPDSKIYALKVFPSTADSAPSSRVIAAMDRAITLRRNFNSGMPSTPVSGNGSEDNPFVFNSLKIDVVNMSLGGATFFAGRELDELLTTEMLSVGIAPAVSAGNEGFGAMTASGPGDGVGALGTAAASDAVHERVLRDLQSGVGIGVLYRPTTHTQTAFFSSRGPTADGRFKPDISANGFATYAQGTCGTSAVCQAGTGLAGISLVSGTSFSGPTVAGALALARAAAPAAPAVALRNALIDTANPDVLGDGSGLIDQGHGYLDVGAAIASLQNGQQSLGLDLSTPGRNVRNNIKGLGFTTVPLQHGAFSTHLADLVPGQVAQFFVETQVGDRLTVKLTNITPENAPANQNQLFGDDVVATILDAPTSTNQELFPQDFIATDRTISVTTSPGIVRVAILGDWTNAGRISADLAIELEHTDRGADTAHGTIAEGQTITVPFVVPAGAKQLHVELSWNDDWGRYPTNDLDLLLRDPGAKTNTDGSTASSPERVTVQDPTAGTWNVLIQGFSIFTSVNDDRVAAGSRNVDRDTFELRVTIDGVRIVLPQSSR